MSKKFTNIEILNSIRDVQNAEYQSLIPQAKTNDDCLEIMATFASYPTTKNAFLSTLTNRVGKTLFFDKAFKNPYRMLHKGLLPYGKTVEQAFTEMAEQKNFNEHFTGSTTSEGDLIKPLAPTVKLDYVSQNYQYKFKTSISDSQLRGAFNSPNGLQELIMHAVNSLASSVQYSEYKDMKTLINNTLVTQIVGGGLVTSCDGSGKAIAKQVRIWASKFTFPSTSNNVAGVNNWSRKEDLVFFTTPEIQAELDVEVLANAFNVSCADVNVRTILLDEIPNATISGSSKQILGILADKDLIQCYDTINETNSFYNGEQMATNYFAHKHGIMAGCQFANARVIYKA